MWCPKEHIIICDNSSRHNMHTASMVSTGAGAGGLSDFVFVFVFVFGFVFAFFVIFRSVASGLQ
jgi:hypothetical protein